MAHVRRRLAFLALLILPLAPARSGDGEVRLLTDEAIPRYLSRGQQLARSGEWAKMIDILHRVIVGDAEIFPELDKRTLHSAVHTNDGVLYYPARELCVQELSRLPREGLAVYRATFDVPAEEALKKAATAETLDDRLQLLTVVFDTYLVSSSGDDALEQAANLHLQLGRYFESLALWRRLLDVYPQGSDRDLAMARVKAAYCAARIGDTSTRNSMLERLVAESPGRKVLVEGKRVFVEALAELPVMRVLDAIDLGGSEDWPMAGGAPTRNRLAEDLPADLPREPFWRFRIEERDPVFVADNGRWLIHMKDRETSVVPEVPEDLGMTRYPVIRPVVHGGVLYYKDYFELVSRRVGSGTATHALAQWASGSSNRKVRSADSVRPESTGNAKTAAAFEAIYRWLDYGGSSVVVSNQKIIVTSGKKDVPPLHLRGGDPARQRPAPNYLYVHRRGTGGTIWGWDQTGDTTSPAIRSDPVRFAAAEADRGQHPMPLFRGPGVAAGGVLYTIVEERDGSKENPGGVSLWAFRMRDGRVLYRTQLHHHDEIYSQLPSSANIAVAGSTVYALTNAGVLCAVDALPPGRIRWIRRYPRSFKSRGRGANKRIHALFAHNEPVVAGGKVVIMAPDGSRVQAIDAETGRLAWELDAIKTPDIRHIVGVRGETVVLAGHGICAVDLHRGRVLWAHEQLGEKARIPYGRGFLSETTAYVPSVSWAQRRAGERSYVHRYDLATGERLEKFTFDVPRLGNILCLGGRLIATNEDEVLCFTTPKHEIESLDARIQANREAKAALYLDRSLVHRRAGATKDTQLEDLRAAHTAATAEGSRSNEIRRRMIDLLINQALEQSSVSPLSEAREIAILLRARQSELAESLRPRPYEAQIDLTETEILAREDDAVIAVQRLLDFVSKYPKENVVVDNEITDAPTAARRIRARLMKHPGFRKAFVGVVREQIADAAKRRDKKALAAISVQYGGETPTEEAWFALAKIYIEDNQPADAELAFRTILREFANHPRQSEAHLRLALLLAKGNMLLDARVEQDRGLALLDAPGREKHRELIKELGKLIPESTPRSERPALELPLRAQPFPVNHAQPIAVDGTAPKALVDAAIVVSGPDYVAVGANGKILWRVPNPAGTPLDVGNRNVPGTVAIAAAVSHARTATFIDDDVLIADVFGVTRINSATGDVAWQWPPEGTRAARSATKAVAALRVRILALAKTGHANRSSPLPHYVMRGDVIVSVHPEVGVTAISLASGTARWQEATAKGELAGAPDIAGQLLAIGRAKPGVVDVFDLGAGRRIRRLNAPGGVVLAAPRLDGLGRLYLISAKDEAAHGAALHVLSARDGAALLKEPIPVHSRYAVILHVDNALAVFHDGSSGGDNLHFLELDGGKHVEIPGEDMAREVHTIRDGTRLFVLTHKLGVPDEGARLFRVDLAGRTTLRYRRPARAIAYGKPILTERFIAVAGASAKEAFVGLYEREASKDLSPAAPVFPMLGGRKLTASLPFVAPNDGTSGAAGRFDQSPTLAAVGKGLIFSHPFGTYRLHAGDTR